MKPPDKIKSSEITDQKVYLNRRQFMRGAALVGTTAATGLLYRKLNPPTVEAPKGETLVTACKIRRGGAQRLFYKRETDSH